MILANWEVSKAVGGEEEKDPKSTSYGEGQKNEGGPLGRVLKPGCTSYSRAFLGPGTGDVLHTGVGGWTRLFSGVSDVQPGLRSTLLGRGGW